MACTKADYYHSTPTPAFHGTPQPARLALAATRDWLLMVSGKVYAYSGPNSFPFPVTIKVPMNLATCFQSHQFIKVETRQSCTE